jgi:hypothetical protein
MAKEIYDAETGGSLGEIGETDLQQLVDLLQEESREDRDYWIDEPTLEMLVEQGVSPVLVDRLREALGSREGFDLAWRVLP